MLGGGGLAEEGVRPLGGLVATFGGRVAVVAVEIALGTDAVAPRARPIALMTARVAPRGGSIPHPRGVVARIAGGVAAFADLVASFARLVASIAGLVASVPRLIAAMPDAVSASTGHVALLTRPIARRARLTRQLVGEDSRVRVAGLRDLPAVDGVLGMIALRRAGHHCTPIWLNNESGSSLALIR
jgi:hypothetical protein